MKSFGYPIEFLEELKQKSDIVAVASRYLTLDRKGKTYWARCPFHGEKTPSFAINEIDQYYHCFGCKASGNVFKLVQEMESVSFMEAVKILAEWAHMEVPDISGSSSEEIKRRKQEKDEMLACLKEAAHFYVNMLYKDEGQVARDYLKKRGINEAIWKKFGIGYSPSYQSIIAHLEHKGFSTELQKKVGIIKERDGRLYDALGERVIFPTINIYSEVIAFCGRTLKQKVDYGKYINTAETPIFFKGKNLFGINLIKKKKQEGPLDYIIIVEGQIDTISLFKAGFECAVSSMGTALTHDQAKLIKRFVDKVYICYDGDTAGKSATLRGLEILRDEGIEVRVMSLPDGLDPDDYINKYGAESYKRLIDKALPLVEFKLNFIKNKYNLNEIDGKARFTEDAIAVLRELKSDVEAEAYIEYIQKITGSSRDFLRNKLHRESVNNETKSEAKNMTIQLRNTKHEGPFREAEQCVIASLLRNKRYAKASEKIEQYLEPEYKEMFHYVLKNKPQASEFIDEFNDKYEEQVGAIVNFLFVNDENANKQLYDDCLWLCYRTYLGSKQGELAERMKNEPNERRNLMREYNEVLAKIKSRKVDL